MKKDISPEVLAFLKNLPNMPCGEKQGTLTEEDEARIKVMLSNATDPKSLADREALRLYILNYAPPETIEIDDSEREEISKYLRKYAPKFYELLQDS